MKTKVFSNVMNEERRWRGTLRTFARNFSNLDFCLEILPLKDDELVMPEM